MIERWNRYWFSSVSLFPISVFRILVGFGVFFFYLPRQFYVDLYFSDQGILPMAIAREMYDGKLFAFYFNFPSDIGMVRLLHGVFLLALVMLGLGWGARFWALLAYILHILFFQRNVTVIWGADKVATFWLLYLVLADSDRQLSLRKWFFPDQPTRSQDLMTPIAHRLIGIQLCVIYAYSGLEKLKGVTWWYGSALWNVVTDSNLMPVNTHLIAHFPLLLVVGCYLTLVFEIYFPLAVWIKPLRKPWLIYGLLFHAAIGIFMGLTTFSYLMTIAYLFVIDPDAVESWVNQRLKQFSSVLPR